MQKIVYLFILILLFSHQAIAGTLSPNPRQNILLSKNAVPDAGTGVILDVSCYGTNNRGTTNPLSYDSRIFIHVQKASPSTESYLIDLPSNSVKYGGAGAGQCGITFLANDSLIVNGVSRTLTSLKTNPGADGIDLVNALAISNLPNRTPSNDCSKFPMSFAMNLNVDESASYSVIQVFSEARPPQAYYGYNGTMDRGAKISVKQSKVSGGFKDTNNFLQIVMALPGQDGTCGGYHSPLMFYFDESYPFFSGQSNLLITDKNQSTSWVEKNHPGYFLVKLNSIDEAITVDKLFGDNQEFKNGFEAIMKVDSNNDKKINKKDKDFKNLYLWKDINGDGKNDKGELSSLLKSKVLEIDLNYNNEYRIERNRTLFKGRSVFKFKGENGKESEGQVFDVFFELLPKKE